MSKIWKIVGLISIFSIFLFLFYYVNYVKSAIKIDYRILYKADLQLMQLMEDAHIVKISDMPGKAGIMGDRFEIKSKINNYSFTDDGHEFFIGNSKVVDFIYGNGSYECLDDLRYWMAERYKTFYGYMDQDQRIINRSDFDKMLSKNDSYSYKYRTCLRSVLSRMSNDEQSEFLGFMKLD